MSVEGNTASFSFKTENNISKIRLVYNTSGISYDGSTSKTVWEQPEEIAVPQNKTVTLTLPSGTKGFYFELTDDACGVVTTEYVELETAVQ